MGFSFLQIGTLISLRELTTNILELPTGIIADAYGRRRSMVFSFLAYICSFVIFYFFPHYALYALAMIFFAMGEAFRTGTHKAMIFEYLRQTGQSENKVAYYGHTRACSQRGSALSALIAAVLVFSSGQYRIVFIASVLPYIAALFLMISYPSSLDGAAGIGATDGAAGSAEAATRPTGSAWRDAWAQIKSTTLDFINIFRNPRFLRVLFGSASFDSAFKSVKDYIQPILQTLALSLPLLIGLAGTRRIAVLNGSVYFLLFLLSSFASQVSGTVLEKIQSLPRAINGAYLLGAVLIGLTGLFLKAELATVSVALFILFYMLFNLRRPLAVSYVSELISAKVMASGLSGESQLKALMVALLAPLLGFLADALGVGFTLAVVGLLLLIEYPLLRIRADRSS